MGDDSRLLLFPQHRPISIESQNAPRLRAASFAQQILFASWISIAFFVPFIRGSKTIGGGSSCIFVDNICETHGLNSGYSHGGEGKTGRGGFISILRKMEHSRGVRGECGQGVVRAIRPRFPPRSSTFIQTPIQGRGRTSPKISQLFETISGQGHEYRITRPLRRLARTITASRSKFLPRDGIQVERESRLRRPLVLFYVYVYISVHTVLVDRYRSTLFRISP